MENILYEELIDKEFVPISELDEDIPPTYVVLYLKNLSLDTDKKIIVQPVSSLQLQLDNQNQDNLIQFRYLSTPLHPHHIKGSVHYCPTL